MQKNLNLVSVRYHGVYGIVYGMINNKTEHIKSAGKPVESPGVVTMTSSFQMAKCQPPVVKIMSLRKGDRCAVFTIQ